VTAANTNINNRKVVVQSQHTKATRGPMADTAITTSSCDTISLCHGIHAKCQYFNGMQFAGSFEYVHPQAGTWIGGDDDWTYEGPLTVVMGEENKNDGSEKDQEQRNNTKYHGTFQASSNIPSSPPQSSPGINIMSNANLTGNPLKVIGIPHPLP